MAEINNMKQANDLLNVGQHERYLTRDNHMSSFKLGPDHPTV